jgi:hypothetical protein
MADDKAGGGGGGGGGAGGDLLLTRALFIAPNDFAKTSSSLAENRYAFFSVMICRQFFFDFDSGSISTASIMLSSGIIFIARYSCSKKAFGQPIYAQAATRLKGRQKTHLVVLIECEINVSDNRPILLPLLYAAFRLQTVEVAVPNNPRQLVVRSKSRSIPANFGWIYRI